MGSIPTAPTKSMLKYVRMPVFKKDFRKDPPEPPPGVHIHHWPYPFIFHANQIGKEQWEYDRRKGFEEKHGIEEKDSLPAALLGARGEGVLWHILGLPHLQKEFVGKKSYDVLRNMVRATKHCYMPHLPIRDGEPLDRRWWLVSEPPRHQQPPKTERMSKHYVWGFIWGEEVLKHPGLEKDGGWRTTFGNTRPECWGVPESALTRPSTDIKRVRRLLWEMSETERKENQLSLFAPVA